MMPASIYILKEKGKTNNPTNIKQEIRHILKSRSTIKIHYTFKNDFQKIQSKYFVCFKCNLQSTRLIY